MSLGSKVMEIINFRNSCMTKYKMAAKRTHGTLVHPVNIDICALDILRNLKSMSHKIVQGVHVGVQLLTRLYEPSINISYIH